MSRRAALRVAVLLSVAVAIRAQDLPDPVVRFPEECPLNEALIGETVTFDITFANEGDEVGFWPFVDLVLDQGGADVSSPPCDGLSFVSAVVASTTPAVTPPLETVLVQNAPCAPGGNIVHPYSGVTLTAVPQGAQLVVLKLPNGSFEPGQPPLTLRVTALISNLADDGHPLRISARGGFRFGDHPTNNPQAGIQPVLNPAAPKPVADWPHAEVTPRVLLLEKTFLGTDNETVPGPNFPEQFAIAVRVAPGQTLKDLTLNDAVAGPHDLEFTKVDSTVPGAKTTIVKPDAFSVFYPQLKGTGGTADVITSTFFATNDLLYGPRCESGTSNGIYSGGADWTPLDPRDKDPVPFVVAVGSWDIAVRAIAVTKSATPFDPRGPVPGSLVEYRISFRLSDYLSFSNIIVDDDLSDGQVYFPGSARFSAQDGKGSVTNQPFPDALLTSAGNTGEASYFCPSIECDVFVRNEVQLPGHTHLRFRFSDALKAVPLTPFPTGTLTGGALLAGGPATGELVFRVTIADKFQFGSHSDTDEGEVDKHDPILDRAVVEADVEPRGGKCSDDGNTCLEVPGDVLKKHIVAKNGVMLTPVPDPVGIPLPTFTRDDTITYRLTKTIPSGDGDDLTIRDWVPQPVLEVDGMIAKEGSTVPHCGALPPQVDEVCFVAPAIVPAPELHVDPAEDTLTFDFGNLSDTNNKPAPIEIYITLEVTQDPFADGLFLTNHAEECEKTSYGRMVCQNAIAQFELHEPLVRIRKGILCTGPPCGTAGKRRAVGQQRPAVDCAACPVSSAINSGNVGSLLQNSVTADASDSLTYIVVLENIGKGELGAFDVRFHDQIDAASPAKIDATSLCVRYGDGTSAPFTTNVLNAKNVDLTLKDPIGAYSPTSGLNLVVVTYKVDLLGPADMPIGSCVTNKATLDAFSNVAGGANFVTAGFTAGTTATAQSCARAQMVKSIVWKSEHLTAPAAPMWIGEIVRYRLRVRVPEGTASPLVLTENLPPGFTIAAPPVVTAVGPVTWTTPVQWTVQGKIDLGTVTNTAVNGDCEYLDVEIDVLVNDIAANNDGDAKPNSFSATAGSKFLGKSNTVTVNVEEPQLQVAKRNFFDGELTRFYLSITNAGKGPAFDVVVNDTIGSCIGPVAIESTVIKGTVVNVVTPSGLVLAPVIKIERMEPQSSIDVTYASFTTDTLGCPSCDGWKNTAKVTWTSLPGNGAHALSAGQERRDGTDGVDDYIATATSFRCGTVCGAKLDDRNGNKKLDPGEGIGGWKITMTTPDGPSPVTVLTKADGTYCASLPRADWVIAEETRPNWTAVYPTDGPYELEVDHGDFTYPGDELIFINKPDCVGEIAGVKFSDSDSDHFRDANESLLPGWEIFAQPVGGATPAALKTVTNAQGAYALTLPGPGTYEIGEVPKDGWLQTYPGATTTWTVTVTCAPPVVSAPVPATQLDFGNVLRCGSCPKGFHCEPQKGILHCVKNQNACATKQCPGRCAYVNGEALCVP